MKITIEISDIEIKQYKRYLKSVGESLSPINIKYLLQSEFIGYKNYLFYDKKSIISDYKL
jgi:hypothetical protein